VGNLGCLRVISARECFYGMWYFERDWAGRLVGRVANTLCRHAGLGEIKDINNRPSHAIPRM